MKRRVAAPGPDAPRTKPRRRSDDIDGDFAGLVGNVVFRTVVFACSVRSVDETARQLAKMKPEDGTR